MSLGAQTHIVTSTVSKSNLPTNSYIPGIHSLPEVPALLGLLQHPSRADSNVISHGSEWEINVPVRQTRLTGGPAGPAGPTSPSFPGGP